MRAATNPPAAAHAGRFLRRRTDHFGMATTV